MSARIKYDVDSMKFMSLFESITKAKLKDCVVRDNFILFIVQPGEIGRAVGAKGVNVRKLERLLKKRVKIVEFDPEPVNFIKNLIHPLKVKEITEEDGVYTLVPVDLKTRGMLIGRNASHLRAYEEVIKRYFPVQELKVS